MSGNRIIKLAAFTSGAILAGVLAGKQFINNHREVPQFENRSLQTQILQPPLNPNVINTFNQWEPIRTPLNAELSKKMHAGIKKAFDSDPKKGPGFFILTENDKGQSVAFIKSPTQNDQIVDEADGYGGEILTSDIRNYTDKDISARNQELFDAVLRGMWQHRRSENGLIGWRCFHYTEEADKVASSPLKRPLRTFEKNGILYEEGIEFISVFDTYEATDAPLKIAGNLIRALQLVEDGKWSKPSEDIDYEMILSEMLPRIRDQLVIEVNGRYVLSVSDGLWAGKDVKGCVTFNPSYGVLSDMYLIAYYLKNSGDMENAEFFLKLHYDTFEAQTANFEWAEKILEQIQPDHNEEYTRIEAKYVNFLISMLHHIKVTPSRTKEFKKYNLIVQDKNYTFEEITKGKKTIYLINRDGTWDIETKTLSNVINIINEHKTNLFFPDQVEVEVQNDPDRSFRIRIERGAMNLGPTEGNDGIRVYSELARYLYTVYKYPVLIEDHGFEKYKIADRALELLSRVLPYREADDVIAERYHNSVALANYYVSQAAYGDQALFEEFADTLNKYPNFSDPQGGSAQYYNFFTALRNLAFYEMAQSEFMPLITVAPSNGIMDQHFKRPEKILPPLPKPFSWVPQSYAVDMKNLDYFVRASALDISAYHPFILEAEAVKANDPYYKLNAERRYLHYKEVIGIDDPQNRLELEEAISRVDAETAFYFADSLLGIGAYHEAADTFFYIVKHMPAPKVEIQKIILGLSLEQIIAINRILNVSHNEIADLLEWLVEHPEYSPGEKDLYIRTCFMSELNQVERTTETLAVGLDILEKYNKAYGDTDALYALQEMSDHMLHSGDNLHTPLPRERILTLIISNLIYAVSRTYTPVVNQEYGILERDFNYADGFALGNIILGDKHPAKHLEGPFKSTQIQSSDPTIKRIAELFSELRDEIPEDMYTQILLAQARIFDKMAWDAKEQYATRGHLSKEATEDAVGNIVGYDNRIKDFNSSLEHLKTRREFLKLALSLEIADAGRNNPQIINEILKALIGNYLFSVDLTFEKNRLITWTVKRDPQGLTAKEKKIQKSYQDEYDTKAIKEAILYLLGAAGEITKTVNNGFENPLPAYFKPQGNIDQDLSLATARLISSLPSTDPRNAQYIGWLKISLDINKIEIRILGSTKALHEALKTCQDIATLEVSNKDLKTQYLYESVIQSGEVLYEYMKVRSKRAQQSVGILRKAISSNEPLTEREHKILGGLDLLPTLAHLQEIKNSKHGPAISILFKLIQENKKPTNAELQKLKEADLLSAFNALQNLFENKERKAIAILFKTMLNNYSAPQKEKDILDKLDLLKVYYLLKNNQKQLKHMYLYEPSFEAKAWARFGNLTWWGETSPGNIDEARKYFRKALHVDPYNINALISIAQVHNRLGNIARMKGQGKSNRKHLETAYHYALKAIMAMGNGIDFSSNNIKQVTTVLSRIINNKLNLPAEAKIRKVLERRPQELTMEDLRRIIYYARRANIL